MPTRPSFPKQGASCSLTLSLSCITHPEQLNHGVSEGKAAAGRTLTWMLIGRSLMQTKPGKFFSLGSAWSGTDEQMVQLYLHGRYCNSCVQRYPLEPSWLRRLSGAARLVPSSRRLVRFLGVRLCDPSRSHGASGARARQRARIHQFPRL